MPTMHPRRTPFSSYAEYLAWSRRRLERSGTLGALLGALLLPLAWLAHGGAGHPNAVLLVFVVALAGFTHYARYLRLHAHLWHDEDSVRGMQLQLTALVAHVLTTIGAALALATL